MSGTECISDPHLCEQIQ